MVDEGRTSTNQKYEKQQQQSNQITGQHRGKHATNKANLLN